MASSASIQSPIVGIVTENIYHAGKLVIPAGTQVHGTAQTDHHRERISSGNSWTLVWQTGEELHLKALALDREFSCDQEGWGMTGTHPTRDCRFVRFAPAACRPSRAAGSR